MRRFFKISHFQKSAVFSAFLPVVLQAECTDCSIEITLMMYCMF